MRTRVLGLLLLGTLVAAVLGLGLEWWPSAADPVPAETSSLAPGDPAQAPPSAEAPEPTSARPGLGAVPRAELVAPEARPWLVRGRVTDVAGRPVPDAEVVLAHAESGPADRATVRARTRTDADGRFRLSLGAGGDRRGMRYAFVSATAADLRASSHFPTLDILPMDAAGVLVGDLVLYPVGTLTGRVSGDDDAPVPGAEVGVWARWAGAGTEWRRFPCAPDGRFTVEGLFGTISCRAFAPGLAAVHSALSVVPVGGTLRKDLRMTRLRGRLRLRFLDPDAKPVAGLLVTAASSTGIFEETIAPVATTDSDGQVTFEGLDPEPQVSVAIEASGDPWCRAPPVDDVEVSVAPSPPLVTIPVLRGSKVRGLVRASTGEPLGAGYVVSLSSHGSTAQAVTDAAGRIVFESPIPAGSARIEGSTMLEPYDVEVTPGTCELDVVVEPCVRVQAHVLRSDGAPLCARWPGDPRGKGLLVGLEVVAPSGTESLPLEIVSDEGVFAAWVPTAQIRGSRVAFRLHEPRGRELAGSPSLGRVRTGQTIRVDLRVPAGVLATVRGRVVVRGSPTPVTHVSVHLNALDGPTRSSRSAFFWGTDRIELPLVPPGRHELHVYDGGGTALRTLAVPETGVLDLGDIEVARR